MACEGARVEDEGLLLAGVPREVELHCKLGPVQSSAAQCSPAEASRGAMRLGISYARWTCYEEALA